MVSDDAQRQLDAFIDKFSPDVAARTREELSRMRALLPCAIEMVYDNYNALAIGFGPSKRASEAIFSLAVFPRWVTLCFLQGAKVPDPEKRLNGSGNQVRHIRLTDPATLLSPPVRSLMLSALAMAKVPLSPYERHRVIIKSISAKQRPRR
ncbi:MAG: hypothetical protein ABL931_14415 [Usitatibacteraceae bacterium]